MLKLPHAWMDSPVNPDQGLRVMVKRTRGGKVWRLWASILPLICLVVRRQLVGTASNLWGQISMLPALCPMGPAILEAHLGSGLGEGPVLTAPWNLRPPVDVPLPGGINTLSEHHL